MNTFKMRIEYMPDVHNLWNELRQEGKKVIITHWIHTMNADDDRNFQDAGELVMTADIELNDLIGRIKNVPDGHVIAESVDLIDNYTGERYSERSQYDKGDYTGCMVCKYHSKNKSGKSCICKCWNMMAFQ
jgi:hypothetical protein